MSEFITLFYILLTLAIQSILLVRYFNEVFYSILFYSILDIDPTWKWNGELISLHDHSRNLVMHAISTSSWARENH